jgi:hypothetical protein
VKREKTLWICLKFGSLLDCVFSFEFAGESNHVIGEQPIDDIFFLLHPSLRPIPPCPTSQVSMRVYEEHRKVGHNSRKIL